MFIQSLVLSKCASASSSGFPENSGLKCDQFNCGICSAGCCSAGATGGAGASGACDPTSALSYLFY